MNTSDEFSGNEPRCGLWENRSRDVGWFAGKCLLVFRDVGSGHGRTINSKRKASFRLGPAGLTPELTAFRFDPFRFLPLPCLALSQLGWDSPQQLHAVEPLQCAGGQVVAFGGRGASGEDVSVDIVPRNRRAEASPGLSAVTHALLRDPR